MTSKKAKAAFDVLAGIASCQTCGKDLGKLPHWHDQYQRYYCDTACSAKGTARDLEEVERWSRESNGLGWRKIYRGMKRS